MKSYVLLCFALNVFLMFGESLSQVSDSKIKETIEELKKTACTKTGTDDQFQAFAKCVKENNKYASENQFVACKRFVDDEVSDKPILQAVCKTFEGSNDDASIVRCIYEVRQKDYPHDDVVQGTIDALKKCQLTK